MRYFITGHTGFKGAWLTMLLLERGHEVCGYSLDPAAGGLFETGELGSLMSIDGRGDIRDRDATAAAIRNAAPEVVLHLAAQPLVRESYDDPRTTFETNVMGTLSVLEAVAAAPTVKAHVVVTTDKVYRNVNQIAGYVESDPLGGHDPYSSSKAMADLMVQSWVASFSGVPTAVARAGNVIGGGDVSKDRLLPDLLRSFAAGKEASIRFPDAVRPWQHVLDCLNGYLTLADALLSGSGAGEWNFGPGRESFVTVRGVADLAATYYGEDARWAATPGANPHEAQLLALDADKAETQLGWRNRLGFADSVRWTIDWQKAVHRGQSPLEVTRGQIRAFETR